MYRRGREITMPLWGSLIRGLIYGGTQTEKGGRVREKCLRGGLVFHGSESFRKVALGTFFIVCLSLKNNNIQKYLRTMIICIQREGLTAGKAFFTSYAHVFFLSPCMLCLVSYASLCQKLKKEMIPYIPQKCTCLLPHWVRCSFRRQGCFFFTTKRFVNKCFLFYRSVSEQMFGWREKAGFNMKHEKKY